MSKPISEYTAEELSALIEESLKTISREGSCPSDLWHPNFGWILRHGIPTKAAKAFIEALETLPKEE